MYSPEKRKESILLFDNLKDKNLKNHTKRKSKVLFVEVLCLTPDPHLHNPVK